MKRILVVLILACLPALASAQVKTNVTAGSALPPTCTAPTDKRAEEFVLNTDTPPALYLCTATNTWTKIGSGGGGTPGGADTRIQFDDSGSFGGDAKLTWDKSLSVLTLGGTVALSKDLPGGVTPITIAGGDDGSGDPSLVVDNPTFEYTVVQFPQYTDAYWPNGLTIFSSDSLEFNGNDIRLRSPDGTDYTFDWAGAGGVSLFAFADDQLASNVAPLHAAAASAANRTGSVYGGLFSSTVSGDLAGGTGAGLAAEFQHSGSGTVDFGNGLYIVSSNTGSGTTTLNAGGYFLTRNLNAGTITDNAGIYVHAVTNNGTITNNYALYAQAQAGSATNSYGLWLDEQGVFRIKADNTFDSVYQAIPALYNPQFTKYTPGATDYERIVEQWESNVAVITTEKGGSGTLRSLQLGDASVHVLVSDLKNTGSATGKKVVCVDTSTGQLYASSTGTDCSN